MSAILDPRGSAALDDYLLDLAWSPDGSRLAVIAYSCSAAISALTRISVSRAFARSASRS